MNTKTFTLSFSLFLFLLTAAPLPGQTSFTLRAMLSGQQEVLPVATAATGEVTARFTELNDDEYELVVTGFFTGLSTPLATRISGGTHIHIAYPGRNGGIVLRLKPNLAVDSLSGSFAAEDNTYTVPSGDFSAADTAAIYVNVHTESYPGGELRGNLVGESTEVYYTNLFGSNEVPSVISRAHGALVLSLDVSNNSLSVSGSFGNLSDSLAVRIGGGAHLHFGMPGKNGPVNIVLKAKLDEGGRGGVFQTVDNTFGLNASQLAALRSGGYYANIHSLKFPGGEIRGHVLPPADVLFRAHLSGANEWPVVSSSGGGQVLLHLLGNKVLVAGTFSGLESPVATAIAGGAHLHPGWAGENGPVLAPLKLELADEDRSGTFLLSNDAIELTDDQRLVMIDRGFYLNIHSMEQPKGEIRGQVIPESQAVFTAFLNGNQQIPSVTTSGRGAVKVELMGNRMTATGSFIKLESALNTQIAGGAHLHAGYPGQAGPVIFPLASLGADEGEGRSGRFLPAANTFTLTDGGKDTLADRFFYVNVHSLDHPGGEIRGSVLAEATSYFLAPLSGASEPQGVPSNATGMLAVEVVDTVLTLVGSFKGLGSDFATNVMGGMHLHRAIAGSNGGIQALVNTEIADDQRGGTIEADSNLVTITREQYTDLRKRLLYANIHSADYGSGEIRGQLLPLAGSYFHTTFSGVNEPKYVASTARGGLKLELIDSTLTASGSVTMLEGDFNAAIAGGSHLHLGGAGSNGPITLSLNAEIADDLKSATFSVDSNTFKLTAEQFMALRLGRLYANIHTTTEASGEARGQILSELNQFPGRSAIVRPADGSTLDLVGNGNQEFRAVYTGSTDADGDTIVYVWQLATDEDFGNIIFSANTGRDTFFSTDFSTVDVLLDSNSVALGATIKLYHRVLASDGSNYRAGVPASIEITRNVVTGTRNYVPLGFAARTYPNPSSGVATVNLELATMEAFGGRLMLFNQLGQLQQQRTLDVRVGSNNYPLRVDRLPAGQYFISLRKDDGRLIHTSRIVIQ